MLTGTLSGRVKVLLLELGWSQKAFAEKLGLTQRTVTNWTKGKTPIEKNIPKIAKVTGARTKWLETGEGPMFPQMPLEGSSLLVSSLAPDIPGETYIAPETVPGSTVAYIQTGKKDILSQMCRQLEQVIKENSSKNEKVQIITVGDNGMSPGINENDLGLIDYSKKGKKIKPGLLYALKEGDEILIRRLVKTRQDIMVKADNSEAFESYLFDSSVEVIGRVLWVGHALNSFS